MNLLTKNYIIQEAIIKLNNKGYSIIFNGLYKDITINGKVYKCKEGLQKIKEALND